MIVLAWQVCFVGGNNIILTRKARSLHIKWSLARRSTEVSPGLIHKYKTTRNLLGGEFNVY